MGRSIRAADAYIAKLEEVAETLDDVMQRERGLSPILGASDGLSQIIQLGDGQSSFSGRPSSSAGSGRTAGSGGPSRIRGARSEREQEERADLDAWRAYVRDGGYLNFNSWRAEGRPAAFAGFGFRGSGSGLGAGSTSAGSRTSAPSRSPGSGQPAAVRDDATATEVRNLHNTIKKNGGSLL